MIYVADGLFAYTVQTRLRIVLAFVFLFEQALSTHRQHRHRNRPPIVEYEPLPRFA